MSVVHAGENRPDTDRPAPPVIRVTQYDQIWSTLVALLSVLIAAVWRGGTTRGTGRGRPGWVLLPFAPDWRWTLDGETSPWYPTARLFRQSETREWDSVIARVRDALLEFIGSN